MARIEVEINGARYISDSEAGPGRCADCALKPKAKSCHWSMVCANVTNGAIFKAQRQKEIGKTEIAEYYEKKDYTGD